MPRILKKRLAFSKKSLVVIGSNQMKKTQNKEKITLNIFEKVNSLHIKKLMKKNTKL
jgi:hypothetical protein